ncbi:MAG TPA: hypothetical protein VFK32_01680 [Tepidiformaceae bacterium]|nr:hypothetical protein [Tepidiformaceae bacterium]
MTEDTSAAGWDGWVGPRTWVPALIIVGALVIALGVFAWTRDGGESTPGGSSVGSLRVPAHEHADFALVIDGEQFDFNQPQFLSDLGGKELSPYSHIHAPRTNVVHVHYTNTTWDEFLKSLDFDLSDTSITMPDGTKHEDGGAGTIKFVVNGVPIDALQFMYITDLDRVLISFGSESIDEVLEEQWPLVTDQACIVSELCMDRVDPNEPKEQCTGAGACS